MSRLKVLEYCHWTAQEKLDALDHLTLTALMVRERRCSRVKSSALYLCPIQEFVDHFKRQLFVEALVQGNITSTVSVATVSFSCMYIIWTKTDRNSFVCVGGLVDDDLPN